MGGTRPTFLFIIMLTQDIRKELETLIERLGLELVSLEWKGRAGQGEVQIVIDRDDGVTIKDCELDTM